MNRFKFKRIVVIAVLLVFSGAGFSTAEADQNKHRTTHADTARFLAGLTPSARSPLLRLTKLRGWRVHARSFNRAWTKLDRRQLSKIRRWSRTHLPGAQKTMLYMFSGPDFLYANAFYPNASTYVFAGLEPVGSEPNLMRLSRRRISAGLSHLRSSVSSVLRLSFFRTREMRRKLSGRGFRGTLPILYVFLARAGKTVDNYVFVKLHSDGTMRSLPSSKGATGVKIEFSEGKQKKPQVLYYFSTDLSNGGVKKSGFLKFLRSLGPADSFLKSASYLLHSSAFSTVRKFLINRSRRMVQDDSGIPLRYYQRTQWSIEPFGRYAGPIRLFAGRYQSSMRRLFRDGRPQRIDFGIGYRWRPRQSSFIVAIKRN